jgi:hypothetical protein
MPYKHIEKLIPIEHDRRVKLNDIQRQEIRELYESGSYSQRGLAKLYGVSRRLIVFILDPLKHQANIARKQELLKTKSYYDKDKQRAYMQSHRQYKQQLYLDNKLIDKSLEPGVI